MSKHFVLILSLLAVTACGQRPDEPENAAAKTPAPATSETAASPDPAPVEAPKPATAKVTFEPEMFEDCTPPKYVVATVSWDATASGVPNVDVKTVGADGSEGLFATGAPVGSKQTDAWVGPGSTIVVRNRETGEELGRGVAGSKPCGT